MKKNITGSIAVILFTLLLGACSSNGGTSKEPNSEFKPPKEITQNNTALFSENGADGVMYSKLINGTIEEDQNAVVLTDEQCEEDANGITHCFNNIQLENGDEIRVNTLHKMQEVPCLSPEEKVEIKPDENGYVKISRNS